MTAHGPIIAAALRAGATVSDVEFDQLLPPAVRRLSAVHWTPVAVAVRAAAVLAPERGMRVLDVGAGPGKLCCIGALVTDARWTGVEREPHLVATARGLAVELGVAAGVRFDRGDAGAVRWRDFDSLYFFNPFETTLFGGDPTDAGLRWAAFADEIERTAAALADLPSGTRIVTYHGYGGDLPPGFVLESSERIGDGVLAAWTKASRRRAPVRPRAGWQW